MQACACRCMHMCLYIACNIVCNTVYKIAYNMAYNTHNEANRGSNRELITITLFLFLPGVSSLDAHVHASWATCIQAASSLISVCITQCFQDATHTTCVLFVNAHDVPNYVEMHIREFMRIVCKRNEIMHVGENSDFCSSFSAVPVHI